MRSATVVARVGGVSRRRLFRVGGVSRRLLFRVGGVSRRLLSIVASSLALVVGSCSGGEEPFDRAAMLASLGQTVILPTYRDFAARAGELDAAAIALCEAPSEATLASTRAAYGATREVFAQAEAFAIGPHTDSPRRLAPKVNFWPVRPDLVEAEIVATTPIDLDATSSAARGLPALGYLLFGLEGEAAEDAAIVAALEGRRCEYLRALTRNLQARADEYELAWSPEGDDFAGQLAEGRGTFASVQASSGVVFEQLVFTTENVRELKIGKPFGKRDGGVLQLGEQEDRLGRRSLADAHANVRSVQNVWTGRYADVQGIGVRDWLLARRPALEPEVAAAFDAVHAAFDALGDRSLDQAIAEDPDGVEAVYQAVKDLQTVLAVDVAQALAVTVTFNPTDGD